MRHREEAPRHEQTNAEGMMKSELRLTDLKRDQPSRTRLMNVMIPAHVSDAIGCVADTLGASKTDVVMALLNEGLDQAALALRGWRRPTISAPPPKRTCSVKGCGRPYVAKGLCANHYQAARRVAKP